MCDSILQNAVLTRVAAAHGVDPEGVCLGDKGAVFYRSGDDLKCLCQVGSHYWNQLEAEVVTAQTIAHAARR